jgi:hypothetical protein
MAIKALAVGQTVNWSLPNDTDNPTVWKLRILPGTVMKAVKMRLFEDADIKEDGTYDIDIVQMAKAVPILLRAGLDGFENFLTPDGKGQIKPTYHDETVEGWNTRVLDDTVVDQIPWEYQINIASAILRNNQLTVQEGNA